MKFSTYIVLTALLCLQFTNLVHSASAPVANTIDKKVKVRTQSFNIKATTQVANIDGNLTEGLWDTANKLTNFHQIAPTEFSQPAEKTEVYVTYNKDYLYIAAKLYDSNIDALLHKVIAPGQNIFSDDYFALVLDTFNDNTNGYFFATNANGYKEEALTLNNNQRITDWKAVWIVESKIKQDHWVVEIAIPFKSINFDPNVNNWGINFIRELKDPQQTILWSSHGNSLYPWASEFAGKAKGFITKGDNAVTQGVGLDIKLSVTANQQRDYLYDSSIDTNNTTSDGTPSLDIFYKPTPKITTALTFNTDFSATEVDEQQVNLSRFSLYTPEKRDFFLQDAGIFEFGKLSQNGKAFFSRQIGLDQNGAPVNINAGVKVAGQQGLLSFGILGINQQQLTGEEQNLLVSRIKYDINQDAAVGAIVTKGSPIIGETNQLVGSDFLLRNKTWLTGDIIEFSGWIQASSTSYNDENQSLYNNQLNTNNKAYGFTISAPNDEIFSEFTFTEIQNNFNPALGFVNRAGIRQYDLSLSVKNNHKLDWMNWLYHSLFATKVTNMDNQTQSQSAALILFESIDQKENFFQCQFIYQYERVEQAFEVLPNLNVTKGQHSFNNASCIASTGEAYPISGYVTIAKGDFYQGTTDTLDMAVWSNINQFVRLEFNYGLNKIVLDGNQFDLKLYSAKVDVAFSSKVFWNNWFQYNNVDETLGVFSRLRWQYSPVSQLDFVLNQSYIEIDKIATNKTTHWQSQQQDIALKLSYTYRF